MARVKRPDRLTMDSIAAQKAGMSYGRWKAQHPHTEAPEPEPPKKGPQKLCKICGREIPNSYPGRLYCGMTCSYEGKLASARKCYSKKKGRMMADGNS